MSNFNGFYLFLILQFNSILYYGQLVDGYTNKLSYYSNEKVKLYLNYKRNSNLKVNVYDASGKIYYSIQTSVFPQKNLNSEPWKNGFDYKLTCEFPLTKFKPGFYQIEKNISFVVKSVSKQRLITIVFPSNTLNAYSNAGGKSLYKSNSSSNESDSVVSFMRPMNYKDEEGNSKNFNSDLFLGMYKWLNENLFLNNLTNYVCDQDLENKSILDNSKLLIIVGHSEYWTRNARKNLDEFLLKGKNALIMSGNSFWWQIRFKNDNQQMICYRSENDPIREGSLKTIEWLNTELNYPIELTSGLNFKYGGYGMKKDKGWDGFKVVNSEHPIFESTNLLNGSVIPCPSIEYDGFKFSGFSNDSIPIVDTSFKNLFYKYELLGFDRGVRNTGSYETIGAILLTQKEINSGQVIHIGSTDWCRFSNFYGENKMLFQTITSNCINFLLPELVTIKKSLSDKEVLTFKKKIFFPNPSNESIYLNQSDFNIVKIEILDEMGKQVLVQNVLSNDNYFNFPQNLKGLFYLNFELKDGTILNDKIVLN